MAIKHVYNQTVADGTATSVVRPSDWNSNHNLTYALSGNTTGSSQISGNDITFVGGNDIFLSADTAASKLVFEYKADSRLSFDNLGPLATASGAIGAKAVGFRQLHFFPLKPFQDLFNGNMTVGTLGIDLSISGSTATMSGALSTNVSFGLYTVNTTAATLSFGLLNSFSTQIGYGAANANNTTGWQGQRYLSAHSSQWSSLPVLSDGVQYYCGLLIDSSGASSAQTGSMIGGFVFSTAARSGFFGVNPAAATWNGYGMALGIYGTTTQALPAGVNYTQINKQSASANFVPHIVGYNHTNMTAP